MLHAASSASVSCSSPSALTAIASLCREAPSRSGPLSFDKDSLTSWRACSGLCSGFGGSVVFWVFVLPLDAAPTAESVRGRADLSAEGFG